MKKQKKHRTMERQVTLHDTISITVVKL